MSKALGFILFLVAAAPLLAQPVSTLSTGTSNPAAANVPQGATGRACIQFRLIRSVGNGQLEQIVVGNSGTAGASAFSQARLYTDTNNNGQFDTGEPLLASATSGAFPRTFSLAAPEPFGTAGKSFVIVVDVTSTAPAGDTFALTLATAGVTINNGTMAGSTVTGGTQTVQASPEFDVQRPAGTGYTLDFTDGGALTDATSAAFDVTAGGGGGSGGGGGKKKDSGCSTGTGDSAWLMLAALASLLALGARRLRRRA